MKIITLLLGLAPKPPKTGGREAATLAFLFSCGCTIYSLLQGPEFIAEVHIFLAAMFIGTLGLFAHAYNLKSEKIQTIERKDEIYNENTWIPPQV